MFVREKCGNVFGELSEDKRYTTLAAITNLFVCAKTGQYINIAYTAI